MRLVLLLDAAKDRDGVLDRGLAHEHLLEPPLERGILLDVLAVLVEGRRPDHAQLAAGKHRLEHVAGVHRALTASACADDRVKFIDERDDLAVGLLDLVEHRLQPLLELTAVLRAGDHRCEIERDEGLAHEACRDVALDDSPRKALNDSGLADAWLADENRVVLRAAREHLDGAAHLLVAADDRVDLALARTRGQVDAVFLKGLKCLLWIRGRHAC